MMHVLELHSLSRSELQIDRTNTTNSRTRPIPHQQGDSPPCLVERKQENISTHMNISTGINPPIR
jgi:hypothetical protein